MRALLLLLVAAALAGGGFWYWTTTPQYSLLEVKNSVKTHDLPKFRKLVDTEEFASSMVDQLITDPMRELIGGGILGRMFAAGMSHFVKPTLITSIKEDLENYVENGQYKPKDGQPSTLNSIDTKFGFKHLDYQGIDQMNVDGKIARASLRFKNTRNDKIVNLDVQLRDMGGYWQVTRILNFAHFLEKLEPVNSAQFEVDRAVTGAVEI